MTEADVIIIGAGLHGSSAAFQLTSRGRKVIVIERDRVARHASGASAGGVRRLRRHRAELPLAVASLELWNQIESLLGSDCGFAERGHLLLGESEDDMKWAEERAATTRAMGYDFEEVIDANEVRRLVPGAGETIAGGIIARKDGFANPLITTAAFRKKAQSLGAVFHENVTVRALEARADGGWSVITSRGVFRGQHVVNAAGGWGSNVARMLDVEMPVEIHANMMTVTVRVPEFLKPVCGHISRRLSLKQMQNGTVVIGGGTRGYVDLKSRVGDVTFEPIAGSMRTVISLFPILADVPIVRCWAGLEGFTPDGVPYLGLDPARPGVVHSFGYSGHGFQLGPIAGRIVADLVTEGKSSLPIAAFAPDRFAEVEELEWGASEGVAREETRVTG